MTPTGLLRGVTILLAIQWVSTLIISWLNITFPAPLVGMLMLYALLQFNIIKEEQIKDICDFIISKMGILFLPAGVSILLYMDLVKQAVVPIFIVCIVGNLIILLGTTYFAKFLDSMLKGGNK